MLDQLRSLLHRAITTPRGDSVAAIRVPKDLARGLNEMLGAPLCTAEELERRRAAARRLAELRARPTEVLVVREPAPVMVYFEKDRNQRELSRLEQVLAAKNIEFTKLDVTGDQATLSFVTTEAKCDRDELPVVFVAGKAIGGFRDVVAADTKGELTRAVFGS